VRKCRRWRRRLSKDDLEEQIQDGADLDLFSSVGLEIRDVDLEESGWLVQLKIENTGVGRSEKGSLELSVIHIATEEMLGKASRPVPSLEGGDKLRMNVLVEAEDVPTRNILIGASLLVPDLNVEDNDLWHVPWKETIKGEEGKQKSKWMRQPGTVQFLRKPSLWLAGGNRLWGSFEAVVSGGDSSRRLGDLKVALVSDELNIPFSPTEAPTVWISVPDLKRRVVPAKALVSTPLDEDFCVIMGGEGPLPDSILLRVDEGNIEPIEQRFPLDPVLSQEIRAACNELTD
jgi:hypothetical protein